MRSSSPLPTLAGRDTFVGLLWHPRSTDEADRIIAWWHLATVRVDSLPLPDDVWYVAHDIVASPDGRFIPCAGSDSTGTYAMVRSFPDLQPVLRLASSGGCDCDVDTVAIEPAWY